MKYGRWTLVIVGAVLLTISAWALAQDKGKAHKRLSTLERLTKAVDLTDEQQEKLKTPAGNLDRATSEWREALDKVLTPEQKQKLKESLKGRFQNRRQHGGQEGAPGGGKEKDDD